MSHASKNGPFGHPIPAREAGVLCARHNSTPRLEISKSVSPRAFPSPVGSPCWVLTKIPFTLILCRHHRDRGAHSLASGKGYFLAQQRTTKANKMRFFDLHFQSLPSLKKKKIPHTLLCSTPWLLAKMAAEKECIIQHSIVAAPPPATKVRREQTEQGHWAAWMPCMPCSY